MPAGVARRRAWPVNLNADIIQNTQSALPAEARDGLGYIKCSDDIDVIHRPHLLKLAIDLCVIIVQIS